MVSLSNFFAGIPGFYPQGNPAGKQIGNRSSDPDFRIDRCSCKVLYVHMDSDTYDSIREMFCNQTIGDPLHERYHPSSEGAAAAQDQSAVAPSGLWWSMADVFLGLKSQATCLCRFAAEDSKNRAEQDWDCPLHACRLEWVYPSTLFLGTCLTMPLLFDSDSF